MNKPNPKSTPENKHSKHAQPTQTTKPQKAPKSEKCSTIINTEHASHNPNLKISIEESNPAQADAGPPANNSSRIIEEGPENTEILNPELSLPNLLHQAEINEKLELLRTIYQNSLNKNIQFQKQNGEPVAVVNGQVIGLSALRQYIDLASKNSSGVGLVTGSD